MPKKLKFKTGALIVIDSDPASLANTLKLKRVLISRFLADEFEKEKDLHSQPLMIIDFPAVMLPPKTLRKK